MKKSFISAFLIALLFTLLFFIVASADVGWDINSFDGPNWQNPGYEFTFNVTGLTGGTGDICVIYSVDGASPPSENHCTCSSPDCSADVGTWHCVIPINHENAAIVWDISGWTGGSCNGTKFLLQEGTFNTGTTAIELSSFDVNPKSENLIPYVFISAVSVVLLAVIGAFLRRYRRSVS